MKEKEFEGIVRRFLAEQGVYQSATPTDKIETTPCGWHYKTWGGGYQVSGIPDIVACINGIFVAVELKVKGGRITELQKLNVKRINEAGGIGIILYPEGFTAFKMFVKEVIRCNGHIAKLKRLKLAHININYVMSIN